MSPAEGPSPDGPESCFRHAEIPADWLAIGPVEHAPVCGACAVYADGCGIEVLRLDGEEPTGAEWDALITAHHAHDD